MSDAEWIDGDGRTRLTGQLVGGQSGGPPTGPAGGDLAGTYPNPLVANGAVTYTKLNANVKPSGTATPADEALRALGTGSDNACAGNDTRLTNSRPPNGTAGGDLTGSYPNPTLGLGVVASANVSGTLKPSGSATPATEALRALGATSDTACSGSDSRLSDARTPTGTAGGDLTGTYPNPTVANGKITVAKMSSGAAANGLVATADGAGNVSWVAVSGGVASVTAADTSIVMGGTSTNPTVRTNTLDVIAADHPPAADWSNNSHKITSLANGSAATDALAVGQVLAANVIPVGDLVAGSAGQVLGGTGPSYSYPPGHEFDYVQITTNATVSGPVSSQTTIITGNSVTYDGSTRILIQFFSPAIQPAASVNAFVAVELWDGSTDLCEICGSNVPASGTLDFPAVGMLFLTPSAAAHQFIIKAFRQTSPTTSGLIAAGNGSSGNFAPAFMRITKA